MELTPQIKDILKARELDIDTADYPVVFLRPSCGCGEDAFSVRSEFGHCLLCGESGIAAEL